ncbi:LysM peptidoglycan-binding domain-containing protein [Neisseriaceae bacterium ESL0693]|nr:LysM peptidoglycan-binding domain-containing protein [Neisseriaceae bacterium ESL0693]
MAQLKHIALTLTSLVFVPSICLAQSYSSNDIGLAIMNLNAATLKGKAYSMNDIWGRIRRDFRMTEVNPELVRQQEQFYASRSDYLNRMIDRSQPYIYHIVTEAEKRQIPAEVALLPFIESAFVNKAQSRVGASGLWQFMPASGRQYGLEQNNLYDGRHDVYAATDAALTYLQYLHDLFGDWSLALAAYNWGEGNVGKAIKRAELSGIDPTYENLRLPNETRNYVPKLLAVRNIIENPEAFGIRLASIPNKPYFEAINIEEPIDITSAARLANISISEFLALNPSFRSPVFIPKANRKMLLPISAVKTFERNYRQADKNSLLSWNIYTADQPIRIMELAEQTGMNISDIKRLNNLHSNIIPAGRSLLLSKNDFNIDNKRSIDGIDSDTALDRTITLATNPVQATTDITTASVSAPGSVNASSPYLMKVSMSGRASAAATFQTSHNLKLNTDKTTTQSSAASKSSAKAKATTHKVVTGDTLFSIAQKYHLNVADLVTANNLRGNNIHPGQILAVSFNDSDLKRKKSIHNTVQNNRKKTPVIPASYTIKKGDTLTGIAQQFNIPVQKLRKVHGNKILRPGQKIKLTNL